MPLDFSSPYYPYSATPNGNNTLSGAEKIPYQILRYLLDLPDANGYAPIDDNARPRVRLAKYLWYDTSDPLSEALPTAAQKLSMLYDPTHPDINTDELKEKHPSGYRLFWQHVIKQSLLEEKTFLKCYLGRIFTARPYLTTIGVRFDIWCGSLLETSMKTDVESRAFAIEQAITEALAPINMTGIGAFSALRSDHADNGSNIIWTDGSILGRSLHLSLTWTDEDRQTIGGGCESC